MKVGKERREEKRRGVNEDCGELLFLFPFLFVSFCFDLPKNNPPLEHVSVQHTVLL